MSEVQPSDEQKKPPGFNTTSCIPSYNLGITAGTTATPSYSSNGALTAAAALASAMTSELPKSAPLQQHQLTWTTPVAPVVHNSQQHTHVTPAFAAAPLHLQFALPLHVLQAPPGASGFHMVANRDSQIPPIFRNRKLRSGKWTPEEEAYTDLLIILFEKGHIYEKNGCTLRSFLSRKLHCAPMRISKKYAGKGIGKMVFLSKTKTNINGIGEVGSHSYAANMAKLRETEANFFKAVLPEIAVPFHQHPSVVPSRFPQTAPLVITNGLAPLVPTPPIAAAQVNIAPLQPRTTTSRPTQSTCSLWTQPPHFSTPRLQTSAVQQSLPQYVSQQYALKTGNQPIPVPVPPQSIIQQQNTQHSGSSQKTQTKGAHIISQQQAPMQSNSSNLQSVTSQQARTLHQAYLSAANIAQQGGDPTPTAKPPLQAQTLQLVHLSVANNVQQGSGTAPNPPVPASSTTASNSTKGISESAKAQSKGASTANQSTIAQRVQVTTFNAPQANDQHANAPPPTRGNPVNISNVISPLVIGLVSTGEIPDFLSGFDKVAKRSNSQAPPMDPAVQYSPTFTSQSFDDFHRFLGKDLSPLITKKNKVVSGISQGVPPFPIPGRVEPPAAQPAAPHQLSTAPNGLAHMRLSIPAHQPVSSAPHETESSLTFMNRNSNLLLCQTHTEKLSGVSKMKEETPGHLGADFYNIFAQQSAFAASQHSAYMSSSGRATENQNFATYQQPPTQPSLIMSIRHNPNVVIEPSSASEQGMEESDESPGESSIGSGNEGLAGPDNASNGSDVTNSDTSSRKKARISYTKSAKRGHRTSNFVSM